MAKSVSRRVAGSAVAVALLSLLAAGALAQGGPPPPDATPGAVGTSGVVLGGIDPAVAPGYRLAVVENTWAPGAYVTRHTHPTAIVVCVQEGALGFAIQAGAATLTRGETAGTPEAAETLELDAEVVLQPRDCVAFDHFAAHTEHIGWNAGEGPLVLWEARLLKVGEPFTTYVDEQGTPVP
jgi:quercetin dioxygenase-like cupin family protein